MKLLYCPQCQDVFKLAHKERACACGAVTGRYLDNVEAVTNGRGVSLAIGGGSLRDSIDHMCSISDPARVWYPVMCWVRPNEGPTNPHTSVRPNKRSR